MKIPTLAIWAISSLCIGHTYAYAQQRADSPPAQAPAAQAVSDAELETFATIYVDLLETIAKFEPELESAQSEQEAHEIQGRMQEESVAKVAQRGWTPEKFNSITDAINRDRDLADKAAKLIEDKI